MRFMKIGVYFFEKRYEGNFEKVVSVKGDPEMSDDFIWAREGTEWRSLLREFDLI
jgi:hypothetical protein